VNSEIAVTLQSGSFVIVEVDSVPSLYPTVMIFRCKETLTFEICVSVSLTLEDGSTGNSFDNFLRAELNSCRTVFYRH
jgi:hypothetical protein